jgi:hypothetical protein
LKRLLSKTTKFRSTPNILKPKIVEKDCNLFGCRIIKHSTVLFAKSILKMQKINSENAGIINWKPKKFSHTMDFYANYIHDYFDTTKSLDTFGRSITANVQGLKPSSTLSRQTL